MSENFEALQAKARQYGQEHIFSGWERLSPTEQQRLTGQIAAVDFELIANLFQRFQAGRKPLADSSRLKPAPITTLPKSAGEKEAAAKAREAGEAALRAGRVGCFLVAGGQGVRLGLSIPKGCFELATLRKQTLYQLHAEKIKALRQRYQARLPWVIMTSDATDAQTRQYFEEMFYFGLGEETVRFAKQRNMPAVGRDGKLLLENRGSLALSPNGHGGAVQALQDANGLTWLRGQGVDTLFYFQVDNVLVRICDPVFLGHHVQARSEFSSKVLRKRDWNENLGLLALLDDRPVIIEYSDVVESVKKELGPDGTLRWWAGSIAIHVLDVGLLERLVRERAELPYHFAEKNVRCIGSTGQSVRLKPDEKNGVKFERFIFDVLPQARASFALETERDLDFAPIKKATGEDSPETASRLLNELYARWLEAAGHTVPRQPDGAPAVRLDISPSTSLEGENLRGLKLPPLTPGMEVKI